MFTNPTTPNLADYTTFLYGAVGIPTDQLPTASGTATGGSTTTLVDSSKSWAPNQWAGYFVCDLTQGETPLVASNTANTLTFFQAVPQAAAAGDSYLIVPDSIYTSFHVSMETVNEVLNCGSPTLYTLAVYNLAADRLINFANDLPNQTYFRDERKKFRISDVSVGVVSATSDEATSTSLLNPETMKMFTLQDLQTLKTPYGRYYMGIAQDYGSTIWGLT
jgi:hypothetical protein